MEVHYRCCAGLDVHRDTVVACIRTQPTDTARKASHQVRTFGTMTGDLLELSEWLTEHEVTHAVMEANHLGSRA